MLITARNGTGAATSGIVCKWVPTLSALDRFQECCSTARLLLHALLQHEDGRFEKVFRHRASRRGCTVEVKAFTKQKNCKRRHYSSGAFQCHHPRPRPKPRNGDFRRLRQISHTRRRPRSATPASPFHLSPPFPPSFRVAPYNDRFLRVYMRLVGTARPLPRF